VDAEGDSPLYMRPLSALLMADFLFQMPRHCNRGRFQRGLEAYPRLSQKTMLVLDDYHMTACPSRCIPGA
jgi:hypothetical protein